jgi:hypothetical protein
MPCSLCSIIGWIGNTVGRIERDFSRGRAHSFKGELYYFKREMPEYRILDNSRTAEEPYEAREKPEEACLRNL